MNKTLLGSVLATMFCLGLVSLCQGKETAMVTRLEGGGVAARIESTSWKPALGEVLPASVAIAIDEGSLLGLLHLTANSELTVQGPKEVTILEDRFAGVDIGEMKRVESLAAGLDLGPDSLKVVGAVAADKISYGSVKSEKAAEPLSELAVEYHKKSTIEFPDDEIVGALARPTDAVIAEMESRKRAKESEMDQMEAVKKQLADLTRLQAGSRNVLGAGKGDVEAVGRGSPGGAVCGIPSGQGAPIPSSRVIKLHEPFVLGKPAKSGAGPELVWLGLPRAPIGMFGDSARPRLFAGAGDTRSIPLQRYLIPAPVDGWTLFCIEGSRVAETAGWFLEDGSAPDTSRQIRISPFVEEGISVLTALIHESHGRFEQAAGTWLKLAAAGRVNTPVLQGHLDRLLEKMTAR